MKKSTKKVLMALAIVFIFGLSTIAFVVAGLRGTDENRQKFTPLDKNVIDGDIDPNTESVYIQNQYTFLRFYYKEKDALYSYTEQLPDIMQVPSGQVQLIVNRLAANETKAEILNLNGNTEVADPTQQKIFDALCQALLFTPTDCLLNNLTLQSNATVINSTK